eukprot:TRINITY_DN13630_c0_g1_i2.p1 TRINITY_DN13630_c0_g1~~TRINITY_DN13630_c0_g1_i2.p1  ORF type:complete len:276 (-),score=38.69 TRINITY_DN13630_c0_g1_i2:21-848(-)
MDVGYDTDEEWAQNPYQVEADAHYQLILQQMSETDPSDEQGASRQGKTSEHLSPPSRPCSRDASVAYSHSLETYNAQTFANSFDHDAKDRVRGRGAAMSSGYQSGDGWASRTRTPCDHNLEQLLEAFSAQKSQESFGLQPPAEAWDDDGHLATSQGLRGLQLYHVSREGSAAIFDVAFPGSSSGEGTPSGDGNSSHEGTAEPAARAAERSDSNIRSSLACQQYKVSGVSKKQEATSSSDSAAETWSQRQIRAAPECQSQIESYEDTIDSTPRVDM